MLKQMKVKPSVLKVDHRYQRPEDEKAVSAIVAAYDPDRIGVLVLSMRQDGSLYILDGQHRAKASIEAGQGEVQILCQVHEGLTIDQEAAWFLLLNSDRRPVDAMAKYKARLVCHEPIAVEIDKIVRANGFRVAMGNSNGSIAAVKAIEWVYRHCGNLDKVLTSAKAWMAIDRSGALDGYMLKSLGVFFSHYEEASPQVFAKRCVRHRHAPSTIIAQIKTTSKNFSFKHAALLCLREVYNVKGRPLAAPAWGND